MTGIARRLPLKPSCYSDKLHLATSIAHACHQLWLFIPVCEPPHPTPSTPPYQLNADSDSIVVLARPSTMP